MLLLLLLLSCSNIKERNMISFALLTYNILNLHNVSVQFSFYLSLKNFFFFRCIFFCDDFALKQFATYFLFILYILRLCHTYTVYLQHLFFSFFVLFIILKIEKKHENVWSESFCNEINKSFRCFCHLNSTLYFHFITVLFFYISSYKFCFSHFFLL